MAEERICSTRTALSEMLDTARRRLERALRLTPETVDQAKLTVADLTARLANHRARHGC